MAGCSTEKSYDQQGFLVTTTAVCGSNPTATATGGGWLSTNAAGDVGGKVRSTNMAARDHKIMPTVLGIVAAAVGGLWV